MPEKRGSQAQEGPSPPTRGLDPRPCALRLWLWLSPFHRTLALALASRHHNLNLGVAVSRRLSSARNRRRHSPLLLVVVIHLLPAVTATRICRPGPTVSTSGSTSTSGSGSAHSLSSPNHLTPHRHHQRPTCPPCPRPASSAAPPSALAAPVSAVARARPSVSTKLAARPVATAQRACMSAICPRSPWRTITAKVRRVMPALIGHRASLCLGPVLRRVTVASPMSLALRVLALDALLRRVQLISEFCLSLVCLYALSVLVLSHLTSSSSRADRGFHLELSEVSHD